MQETFTSRFGLEAYESGLQASERALAEELYRDEIGLDDFVTEVEEPKSARGVLKGEVTGPGGTIRTYIRVEGPAQNRINSALITGDFFVTPPRVIYDLEGALKGVFLDKVESTLNCFFKSNKIEALSVSKDDFLKSIQVAIGQGSE